MKRKSDIRIGQRAYSEVCRLFPDKKMRYITRLIGCSEKAVYSWRDGFAPSALFLARLLQLGADVEWILTGKGSGTHEKSV